ncbi:MULTISPECIES: cytochrome P450 [unclassified Streptomyces]|uniref:cytochrome P450 n=1 Tax=unclassified Streptomyces TaxID=2593676 RepID=UPI000AEE43E6|nr:cytochrome P450 [Streptomyces sp. TSRI0107]
MLLALRPQIQEHLYDFYAELRSADDIFWDRRLDAWIATSHVVVSSAASDPRLSSVRYPDIESVSEELRPLARVLSRQMLYSDAPDHARLRALLSRAFTPRAVATLRDQIREAVDQIITKVAPTGRMDIVADLARPLPLTIICDLLDVPEQDRLRLSSWSDPIAAAIGSSRLDADESRAASQSMEHMLAYLRGLLTRREAPAAHTLRALLTTQAEDTSQDFDELLANCALLLIAGHETTTHFIGNAALALLRNPHAADQLRHRPDLIPAAVEEFLRYDSPVQLMLRRARHRLDLAGRVIDAGQVVLLVCGAANRDPAAFPHPDELDFHRSGGRRHVAFGYGPHFCLGAALARLEGTIVLEALLTRLSDLRLENCPLRWQRSLNFRGLTRLDVTFKPTFGDHSTFEAPSPSS